MRLCKVASIIYFYIYYFLDDVVITILSFSGFQEAFSLVPSGFFFQDELNQIVFKIFFVKPDAVAALQIESHLFQPETP